jgi:hypothetical protein
MLLQNTCSRQQVFLMLMQESTSNKVKPTGNIKEPRERSSLFLIQLS